MALLNERTRIGLRAGELKRAAGERDVRDAAREREVLSRVAEANEGPLPNADLLALYRRLIAATRALERLAPAKAADATGRTQAGPDERR